MTPRTVKLAFSMVTVSPMPTQPVEQQGIGDEAERVAVLRGQLGDGGRWRPSTVAVPSSG